MINTIRKHGILTIRLLITLFILVLAACDSDSGSSSGSGGIQTFSKAEVKGNVSSSSFSADNALGGISVAVGELETATDSSGNFQLSDIPSGEQSVVFSKGSESATMQVDIASGGTLTLSNVSVGRKTASGSQGASSSQSTPTTRPRSDDDDSDDDSNDDD